MFPAFKKWPASQGTHHQEMVTVLEQSFSDVTDIKEPMRLTSVPMLQWLRMFQAQSSKAVKLPHYDLKTTNSEDFFRPEYKPLSLT